ncbi:MAG: helix-turn-helix transcriptional regulator [Clostridia bacterium]|nr:helix-turn-helix transcriptional regulator [Clostridia bacterium]
MSSERIITEEKQFDCHCEVHSHEGAAAVQATMPNEDLLYDLADFFKVLGDSTRVRILMALDVSELCVCDLADALSMTKSAVSHQLRALRQARLVRYRKEGKNVFYSLDDEHVRAVIEMALVHLQHED